MEARSDSTAVSSSALQSLPAPLCDKAAVGLCLGTWEEQIVLKPTSEFVSGSSRPHSPLQPKKHSCGAPTASMHSQVDSATEHFLRKVLFSLTSNNRLYFPCWKMKPTAMWKCFRKGYLVPKNRYQKSFKFFFFFFQLE